MNTYLYICIYRENKKQNKESKEFQCFGPKGLELLTNALLLLHPGCCWKKPHIRLAAQREQQTRLAAAAPATTSAARRKEPPALFLEHTTNTWTTLGRLCICARACSKAGQ